MTVPVRVGVRACRIPARARWTGARRPPPPPQKYHARRPLRAPRARLPSCRPCEVTWARNSAGDSAASAAIRPEPRAVSTASLRAVAGSSPSSMPAASRHSINRKKYAGPLPDTAVTTSSCDSSGTQTVGPQAARIVSAVWRDAASTPGMAYSAVMPAPISAGRFGIVRISGTPGPSQRARSCNRIPAATEMTRAPAGGHLARDRAGDLRHLLWLHGEHHGAGTDDGRWCIGHRRDAVIVLEARALRGLRIGHHDRGGRRAARDEATDQARRHVAATHESDPLGHAVIAPAAAISPGGVRKWLCRRARWSRLRARRLRGRHSCPSTGCRVRGRPR